ncbi:TRDC protein, partial [Eubucco bourcierii]|nr:TRDC protein [Eubucco bourcierii]
MRSKDVGEGAGKAACLARNSNTKSISLEMSPNEVVYEQSPPILTSEGLYSAVKVVSVAEDAEVTCVANFNGITSTKSTASTTAAGETEGPLTGKVCTTTAASTEGSRVEKVNMLSMAVLALRVLLAKTVAFNTLMSIKLFLF